MKTLKSTSPTDSSNVPVVINTMGWMTGLGLELINYALQVFKPSHVLAFMSPVENNEDTILKCLMTNSFELDGALNREAAEKVFVKYMGNPTADFARAKYNPADQRNLSFWSYFFGSFSNGSSIINDFKFLKNISGIRPVIVPKSWNPFSKFIAIGQYFCSSQITWKLDVITGSWISTWWEILTWSNEKGQFAVKIFKNCWNEMLRGWTNPISCIR